MRVFIKQITSNKYFRRFWLPAVVVILAIVMLVSAPWTQPPIEEDDEIANTPPTVVETEESTQEDTSEEPTTEEETQPEETPVPAGAITGIYNPLTGLKVNAAGEEWTEEMSNKRPFGIVIGNTPPALPQFGIGQADLLLEYYVEGTTRFMAVFQDFSAVTKIGGVRSFRESSYNISLGFDIILVHAGGSTYKSGGTVTGSPVTSFNTIHVDGNQWGFRDPLGSSSEHRLYTSAARLIDKLPTNFRTEHDSDFEHTLRFNQNGTPQDGQNAETVTVNFIGGNAKITGFNYNPDTKVYNVRNFNRDLVDARNSEKLGFTNLLILETTVTTGYNTMGHTFIDPDGKDNVGYYVCGGKYVEITWDRANRETISPYYFYNKDGTPLELGAGKTYIAFVKKGVEQKFE